MRSIKTIVMMVLLMSVCGMVYAELQNVEVGGSIRIRGNWFEGEHNSNVDLSFIEQRTRLSVKADFTQNVSAFFELDSYDIWGEDFRSQNYITGGDTRARSVDDVEFYQAYIQASNMWDTGLQLRIGRQEIILGSGWLVGNNSTSSFFTGLSFDAILLSYVLDDKFAAHLLFSKLAETMRDFGENDTEVYGLYLSCTAVENMAFDLYYLFLRDDGPVIGSAGANNLLRALFPKFAGKTAQTADVHTVGLRAAGTYEGLDFEAETAFQFGSISDGGHRHLKIWAADSDLTYSNVGINLQTGYTFDVVTKPHPFVGFAAFLGLNDHGNPDLPFNRLFSNWEYSEFLENTDLSNCYVFQTGLKLHPGIDSVTLKAVASCYVSDKDEGSRNRMYDLSTGSLGERLRHWAWNTENNWKRIFDGTGKSSNEAAWELGLYGDYAYSKDLTFRAGYAHLWTESGVANSDRITQNGTAAFNSGNNKDLDYLFFETELKF
ncbi:MAG TPA: alginate export family protein [Candidatus Hydrogenedentes bacterium]|nr:alginate export family protein [Candidatus Hydrogenedentota bacterium]